MTGKSVSLDDVRVLNIALGWHESVALVQELASLTAGRDGMPDPDLVILNPLGEMSVQGDIESPEPPVRSLGSMLESLLPPMGVPPDLRQLAKDAQAEPAQYESVEAFTRALSFFERPNRRADIAAVCNRAAVAASQVRSDIELDRLRKTPKKADGKKVPARRLEIPKWIRAIPVKTVLVTAVVVAAVATAAMAVARFVDQPPEALAETPSDQPSALDVARLGLVQAVQTGLSAVGIVTSLTPPTEEAAPPAPVEAAPAPRPRASRPRVAAAAAPAPRIVKESVDVTLRLDPTEPMRLPPADVSLVVPTGPRTPVEAAAGTVKEEYSPADLGVVPAELIRPQIPSFETTDIATEEVGVLDLLIDEMGGVAQVRLVSPTNRFQERMMVSAAKAWRFHPALKDGKPVKYRLRVRITI